MGLLWWPWISFGPDFIPPEPVAPGAGGTTWVEAYVADDEEERDEEEALIAFVLTRL